MHMGLTLRLGGRQRVAAATASVIAALFEGGQNGAWYNIQDITTLKQNSDGTGTVAVGDPVGYVADQSGNGNHLLQATSGARPTLQQTAGGVYYLYFDGTDDRLSALNIFSSSYSDAFMCAAFLMASAEAEAVAGRFTGIGYDGSAAQPANDETLRFQDGSANWDSGTYIQGENIIHSLQMEGATYVLRQNGVQVLSVDRGTQTQRTRNIGVGGLSTAADSIEGRFYGGVWVEDVLDAPTRSSVESYFTGVMATPASASVGGGEITITDLEDGSFSYTISGSSITAFNGTYTQDVQSRTLTGALLESERVLWLVAPAIEIATDVASNGLADAGDTLGKTHLGLAIYDPDQGVPDAPTFQWNRDGVAIDGETDPEAYVPTVADFGADATLVATYGGQTATSAAISVETGSAMALDASALAWFEPNNITINTGEVETWPDNTSNSHNLATVSVATRPTWNATNKCIEFRSATPTALRTSGNGPINTELTAGGGRVTVFMVLEPIGTVATQAVFSENKDVDDNNSTVFGIDTADDFDFFFYSRRFSNAFGSQFGQIISTKPMPSGKLLLEYTIDSTSATILANGALKLTRSVNGADLSNAQPLSLGGHPNGDGTVINHPSNCDLYEVFATGSDTAGLSFIRNELYTKHGITP